MDFDAKAGTQPGLEIWRIMNMKPVRVDQKEYGNLFSGATYILLSSLENKSGGALEQTLFFWIGDDSTQDEQGAVAFQTVFLDDKLNHRAHQHREVQGYESPQFLALFKSGITILKGGVASGFHHVDPSAYEPRLFRLRGKRDVRVQQVELARASLNQGDVFILDKGLTIFQWNGSQSNKYEKARALEFSTKVRNEERGGKPTVVVLDAGKNDTKVDEFWSTLGGYGTVSAAAPAAPDDDKKGASEVKLLRVSDSGFEDVASGRLTKDMMDSSGVFLLDSGTDVFCWVGKHSSKQARGQGMQKATEYLKSQGKPQWTHVSRVIDEGEPPAFKTCFLVWDPPRLVSFESKGPAAKEQIKIDMAELHKTTRQAEEKMLDDASGSVQVWRIKHFDKVPVPDDQYGQFYMGESYILQYTYKVNGKDKYIIYFWQGRDSTIDDKGASAIMSVHLNQALHTDPVQVRVVQDKEPNHFLCLFKGRMIVHKGSLAGGPKLHGVDGVSLFQIKGHEPIHTRAVEVDAMSSCLNSADCFVVITPSNMYIWKGKGCNEDEREVAQNISKLLHGTHPIVDIDEGSEPQDFWDALGGKDEYPTSVTLASGSHPARLFDCSITSGQFKVEEVIDFSQDDLIPDDVMLLDTYDALYVWIGQHAPKDERDNAMQVALDYVKTANDGRDASCPVYKVTGGAEPPVFTCHFLGWDEDKANDLTDPFQAKLAELQATGHVTTEHKGVPAAAAAAKPVPKVERKVEAVTAASIGFAQGTFPLADLKAGRVANMDPANKHLYLSDAEFLSVFKVSKAEFAQQPKWKQDHAKKAAGLF